MDYKLKKTIIGLLAISIVVFILGLFLFKTILAPYYFNLFPYLVLVFFVINSAFFIFFYRSLKKSNVVFIRTFMASSGIKIMFYFALVMIFVITSPQHAITFSFTLLLLYFIFTAYDLYVMIKLLKQKKEKNTSSNLM